MSTLTGSIDMRLTEWQLCSSVVYVSNCIVSQLEEDELRGVALLVFANKQDLPRAMSVGDITEALSLSALSRPVSLAGVPHAIVASAPHT